MEPFSSLKPHVTHDEAVAAFQRGANSLLGRVGRRLGDSLAASLGGGRGPGHGAGLSAGLGRVGLGARPLRSVADVYVPYHLFRVEITERRRQQISYVAVDALRGMLDPYQFAQRLDEADLVTISSRNRIAATLDVDAASQIVIDAVRRILFQTGAYRLRAPRISVQHDTLALHVPYYLGFYGNGNGTGTVARLRVLDAVRRRFEGGKARALFEGWLAD
jgi:hypothetical protein